LYLAFLNNKTKKTNTVKMKYSVAFVALAAVAAQAQSLADVPKCALPCLDKAIASETSCDKTDLACVCKDFSKVRSVATSCVIDECGTDVAISESTLIS
jgi:hypothetical protein